MHLPAPPRSLAPAMLFRFINRASNTRFLTAPAMPVTRRAASIPIISACCAGAGFSTDESGAIYSVMMTSASAGLRPTDRVRWGR